MRRTTRLPQQPAGASSWLRKHLCSADARVQSPAAVVDVGNTCFDGRGPLPFADTAQHRPIDRGAERAALPFTQMSSLARRSGCFCQTLLLCAARHFVARNVPPPPPFATVAGASSLHRRSHCRPVVQASKRVVHLTPCSLGSTAERPAHRSARQLKRHASGAHSRRQEYVAVAVQCVALYEGRMAPFIAASLSLFFPSATLRLLPTAIKGIEPAEG
ncbi:hypothetical protein MRX96_040876 [Rhipicephalus microplus]